jgi:cation diffusion facilitator family transporter
MAVRVAPATSGTRLGAAALSIASNSILILLKVVAGTITGSVALLTEALHSAIDLIASIVAFFSIRKADEPADADHPYGHEKVEDLAAAIEGILILLGSGIIVFEAVRRLIVGGHVEKLGFGIAVLGVSVVVNVVVSARMMRTARSTGSPALAADAAHLRTDAATSLGVLVGLVLVQVTDAQWIDPAVALMVALAIVVAGVRIVTQSSRVLVDQALPDDELQAIRDAIGSFHGQGVCGFHKLRARRAGTRRLIDLHVQFVAGTTLEEAHGIAHRLQDTIVARIGRADVLIHLEPEDRVMPGTEV